MLGAAALAMAGTEGNEGISQALDRAAVVEPDNRDDYRSYDRSEVDAEDDWKTIGKAGQGVIYWTEDGTALYKTPDGSMMHGKSEIKGDTNCTEWKERPGTGCTRYDKQGDVITIIDVKSGQVRAKIVKTAPGNAEKLGP